MERKGFHRWFRLRKNNAGELAGVMAGQDRQG